MVHLIFAAIVFAAPNSSDRIEIKQVFGPKEVKVLINNKEKILYAGDEIFLGNTVQTQAKQIVHLEAFDKSEWKVAPDTTLKLEKRLAEKKTLSYWVFGLVKGHMWGKITPHPDKEGFRQKVVTKSAAMGVRGTEYLVAGDQNSEVDVLEGSVWWGTSDKFEEGSYEVVKAGEHSEVIAKEVKKPVPSALKGNDLINKYRLVLSEADLAEAAKVNERSPEDCRVRAEGWKSKDGTNRGNCYKADPKVVEE